MNTASSLVETAQSYLPEVLGGKPAAAASTSTSSDKVDIVEPMSTGTGRVEDPGVKEGGMDIDPDSSRHPELHKKSNEEAMQRERDQLKEKMKQPLDDNSSTSHTHKSLDDSVPVSRGGANDGKPTGYDQSSGVSYGAPSSDFQTSGGVSQSEGGLDLRQGVHALQTGNTDAINPGSAASGGGAREGDDNDVRKGLYSKSDGSA